MRNLLLFMLLVLVYGCNDESKFPVVDPSEPDNVLFRIAETNTPFTGAVEIYPCNPNMSTYYGNYVNGIQSVFNASYIIKDGDIVGIGTPLTLPPGKYTLLYWGVNSSDERYSGQVNAGPLTSGVDMSTLYWRLRPSYNGTFRPTYDQLFGKSNVSIGQPNATVKLRRVVVGIQVDITFTGDAPLNSNIVSIDAQIDHVAPRVNYFTGDPDFLNGTVTVNIPMTISSDRRSATNLMAMFYPTQVAPTLLIVAKLSSGATKTYSHQIQTQLDAGDLSTIHLNIDANNFD